MNSNQNHMKYHLTPARTVAIKKSTNNKCWRGYGEKGNLCIASGNANWYSHCETWYIDSLKKKKTGNRTAIQPSSSSAGPTHWGNQKWKRHMYPSVHCSAVYNSQDMRATQMPTSRWMQNRRRHRHTWNSAQPPGWSQFEWGGWTQSQLYRVKQVRKRKTDVTD